MSKMKTNVSWLGGMKFVGKNQHGTEILMDVDDINGVKPMQMALMSIGGCTAVDVVSTLEKMRQDVKGVEIEVEGLRRDEHPRYFKEIVIIYKFKGNLQRDKVERAVKLSKEKYCSVSNMFEPKANISYIIEIEKE